MSEDGPTRPDKTPPDARPEAPPPSARLPLSEALRAAREYQNAGRFGKAEGYADASGVFRVVGRLEARAKEDKSLADKLARLRRLMAGVKAVK